MSDNDSGETKASVAVVIADIRRIREDMSDVRGKVDAMQIELHSVKTALAVSQERDKAVEDLKKQVDATEKQIQSLKLSWMKLLGALAGSGGLGGLTAGVLNWILKGGP